MDPSKELPFLEAARNREEQIQLTNRIFQSAHLHGDGTLPVVEHRVMRPLTLNEISTLQGPCFSKCKDWGKLRLLLNPEESRMDQSPYLQQIVSFNNFSGVVVIGINSKEICDGEADLPVGIHSNALISNCILDAGCRVYRNMCMVDTYVGIAASVLNCGKISCGKNVLYGHLNISVGPESGGGRNITVTAESNMIDVCQKLGVSKICTPSNIPPTMCNMNFIGAGCMVRDTPTIDSVFLASTSTIEGATSVRNSVLLPTAKVGNACTVNRVMLQWNASIMDHSYISDTLLMEHAHAGPKSLVVKSILGPDVHVAAGEMHSSLIGPNTNAHHQSLVIGVLWPLGRGNVGYGANVGSNHTGRLPDQETCSGEGTFWGLSCVVKFPVDLSYSPYTIVAAGTTVGPQRIAMPFSLLVDMNGETQIIPAWSLQSSPYTLTRNANKYANRRKATHHKFYTGWEMIRPDIVDMCWIARDSLRGISQLAPEYKTERIVPGIGGATLSEKARQSGIHAYTQCIQRYALGGFLEWIQINRGSKLLLNLEQEFQDVTISDSNMDILTKPSWPILPWEVDMSTTWIHQKSILRSEFPMCGDWAAWVADLLHACMKVETEYANGVYKSKKRDDVRGVDTIPGYMDSHVAAEDDEVIKNANEAAKRIATLAEDLLVTLSKFGVLNSSRSRL